MNIYNMYHFLKANNKTLFFLNQSFFCVATEDEDKGAALKTAQLSFSGSCCQLTSDDCDIFSETTQSET